MTEKGVVPYRPAVGLTTDPGKPIIRLADVLEEIGLAAEKVAAEDLVDKTFVIQRAKPFASAFQEDAHAYFCVIAMKDTGERFTTVLGGGSPVELLDAYIAARQTSPLEVTLRKVEGGRFGSYYTLE